MPLFSFIFPFNFLLSSIFLSFSSYQIVHPNDTSRYILIRPTGHFAKHTTMSRSRCCSTHMLTDIQREDSPHVAAVQNHLHGRKIERGRMASFTLTDAVMKYRKNYPRPLLACAFITSNLGTGDKSAISPAHGREARWPNSVVARQLVNMVNHTSDPLLLEPQEK
jgi:hypothetical protein